MDFKIFQKNLDNFFLYSSRNIQNWIIRASSRFLGRCEHQPSCRESIKNDHLNRHRNNCVWTNTHTGSFNWDRQHYLVVFGFIVFGLSFFEIQRVLHSEDLKDVLSNFVVSKYIMLCFWSRHSKDGNPSFWGVHIT